MQFLSLQVLGDAATGEGEFGGEHNDKSHVFFHRLVGGQRGNQQTFRRLEHARGFEVETDQSDGRGDQQMWSALHGHRCFPAAIMSATL
jgi:hypothetical protein